MVRPASLTARSRSSASPRPSADPTASCSCWTSRSSGRPARRCSSPRDVEQHVPGGGLHRTGRVDELRRGQRPQRVHVAQPAAGVLEVRLQQERQLAGGLPAGEGGLPQLRQPLAGVRPPGRVRGLPQQPGQRRVAGEVAQLEQAERGLEVAAADRHRLGDGADRVVQADPGVPDRVPDRVRDRRRRPGGRGAAGRGRGRSTAPARGGRGRRRRPARPRRCRPAARPARGRRARPARRAGRRRSARSGPAAPPGPPAARRRTARGPVGRGSHRTAGRRAAGRPAAPGPVLRARRLRAPRCGPGPPRRPG